MWFNSLLHKYPWIPVYFSHKEADIGERIVKPQEGAFFIATEWGESTLPG